MILPYQLIRDWAESGGIDPFDIANVNPASIDLRWSGWYRVAVDNPLVGLDGWSNKILTDKLILRRGELYLFDTLEYIKMPPGCAGSLALKSSMGRSGLEHLHAGFFDPGFHGTATLEVENRHPRPLVIEKGQRIIQLALMRCEAVPDVSYADVGRYQGQRGPTGARKELSEGKKDAILARSTPERISRLERRPVGRQKPVEFAPGEDWGE